MQSSELGASALCRKSGDEIPGSLGRCIRTLMLANTNTNQRDVKHVYLGEAVSLRPDPGNPPY
ncbi:MAG: chorismate mutase [Desulfotomaculaceae bacterium]